MILKNKTRIGFIFIIYFMTTNYKFFKLQLFKIFFNLYNKTKYGKKDIQKRIETAKSIIIKQVKSKTYKNNFKDIPDVGFKPNLLEKIIENRKSIINNKVSGGIYINNAELENLLKKACSEYLFSNPLHPDLYPELIKMESEIIEMVGRIYNMPKVGGGNLTTGGTESTILALKAYKKNFIKNSKLNYLTKGFFYPEVLCTKTVHAAVNKACELLDLKMVIVDLNKSYVMCIDDLKRKISWKTCVIVASAPCFPYGLMDPIKNICNIANNYNVKVHVDACLGGFITQFGENKLDFDQGFHSVSIDPHKFGYSPKGSSVLLWNNKELKHNQYSIVSDWTGGIYASCSLPGSRMGLPIIGTWIAILNNGKKTYSYWSNKIKEKTVLFASRLKNIKGYKVFGNPNVNVVAFTHDSISISEICDTITKNDWNLNVLQNPLCLHICITPKNIDMVDKLLEILESIKPNKKTKKSNNMVAIYGMAAKLPDKTIIKQLVNYYLDLTTNV